MKHKPHRSALAIFLLLTLGFVASVLAQSEPTLSTRPDLTGTVQNSDGKPIPATVFIYTAGPKVGTSVFCPSCYADCAKNAKADSKGNFKIKSLDPQLIFRILAVAKGYKPKFGSKVDPAKGPVEIHLDPIELAAAPPENCLHGRVVDQNGKPIVGAVVEAAGLRTQNGGGRWGYLPGVDPLAVTDEKGEFLITSLKPFELMDVRVKARAYANKTFTQLASGNEEHQLVLTTGATITGRVLFNGQPLKNVSVGVVSVDRGMEVSTGSFDVGTDGKGRFLLANLPPDVDYYIYGLMNTLKPYGAIPVHKIHSGKDDDVSDVGDLQVVPGHRLAGHVVLEDGGVLPPATRLLISRQDAWDSLQVSLAADGSFEATSIPNGVLVLSVRAQGYRVSAENASLDTLNPFQLIGLVNEDITNITFLLERGDTLAGVYNNDTPESELPKNRPLHGAELRPDHSREWAVSGQVTDSQTGKVIPDFRITPGQEELPWHRTSWDTRRATDGIDGAYTVYLDKRWAQPVLKVEADGYLPTSVALLPLEQTNADFVLRKGTGPSGIVLSPDGKPDLEASVVLICADSRQPGLDHEGHLQSRENQNLATTTDANGNFSFAPQLGMQSVAAASPAGFKEVSVEVLATNPAVTLEPFGEIKGVLERPAGHGSNEDLDLAFVGPANAFDQRINLANSSHTDAAGRFDFKRVPAGHLQIAYRLPMEGHRGWQSLSLQQVNLEPGQTLEVNIKAPARQSPPQFNSHPIPQPVRVPGVEIKGSVVLPNGKPAVGAQVALQVKRQYIALGRASLQSNQSEQEGLIVLAGTDGSFTLSMYEGGQSVIAVSEDGFARVPLDTLKQSPQITLLPWGRIEGTLRIGHHPGTNEVLLLSERRPRLGQVREAMDPLSYDYSAFQVKTDDHGNFVMSYVPPGEQTILRLLPQANGSRSQQQLGSVEAKPGEITHADFGGNGQTVIGRVTMIGTNAPPDWQRGQQASIHTATKLRKQVQLAKTPQERWAIIQSPEYQAAMRDIHDYPVMLSADGSFKAEDVVPGEYEFEVHFLKPGEMSFPPTNITAFTSSQELVVPIAADTNSDAPVDCGTVELKPFTMPPFMNAPTNANKSAAR